MLAEEESKKEIDFLEIETETEFHSAKKELEKRGYYIPSLEEVAQARLECLDLGSSLLEKTSSNYLWTRDFSIYVPGENGIYLGKGIISPIIEKDNPQFHRKGHMWPYGKNYDEKSIHLAREELEKYLSACIFVKQTDLNSDIINLAIPTDSFGKDFITSYLFGKEIAQKYGEFLKQTASDTVRFVQLELGNKNLIHSRQLCLGNVLRTNKIITNKCRLDVGSLVSPDARMVGLKQF